MYQAIAARPVY